jgi:hypothetical protein
MWKRLAKISGVLIFTFCISIAVLAYSIYQITLPEKVTELSEKIATISVQETLKQIEQSELERTYGYLRELCEEEEYLTFPYNGNISINCVELRNKSVEEIAQVVMSDVVTSEIEEIYYENYTCEFFECWKNSENMLYYFSHQANQVFYSLTIYFTMASIFGALLIAYAERFFAIRTIGVCMIFTGIFYFFKFFIGELISSIIPIEGLFAVDSIVELISPIFDNFLYIFVAGTVLLLVSFAAKKLKGKR